MAVCKAVCRECGEGRCVCMRGIFNLIYNLLHFYNRVASVRWWQVCLTCTKKFKR